MVYADTVEKVFTAGKSTMKTLKDFDPLSSELLRKVPSSGTRKKAPVEIYARRTAFVASKSKSLLVVTKYQQALTGDQLSVFKKELDWLVDSKGGESKGKSKRLAKTNTTRLMGKDTQLM